MKIFLGVLCYLIICLIICSLSFFLQGGLFLYLSRHVVPKAVGGGSHLLRSFLESQR